MIFTLEHDAVTTYLCFNHFRMEIFINFRYLKIIIDYELSFGKRQCYLLSIIFKYYTAKKEEKYF